MGTPRVAVVVGGNGKCGFEVVTSLCQQFRGDVILTARDPYKGLDTLEILINQKKLAAKFHHLDITSQDSLDKLKKYLTERYGGLDLLVNCAQVYGTTVVQMGEEAFKTDMSRILHTNFWGAAKLCDTLYPILRPKARVVHISTAHSLDTWHNLDERIKTRILGCTSIKDIEKVVTDYEKEILHGAWRDNGWPDSPFYFSKVALNTLVCLQQQEIFFHLKKNVIVNAACPAGGTAVYAALLPVSVSWPRGCFLKERQVVDWPPVKFLTV